MVEYRKDIIVISNSIKGKDRSHNQDDTLLIEDGSFYLFFLFDGVSSLNLSIDYIQICKQYIKSSYKKYFVDQVKLSDLMYDTHNFSLTKGVYGLSTCSAFYLSKIDKNGYFFNIGDSRIYEYSNQFIEQITIDDSLPGSKNILTKCLGSLEISQKDFFQKNIILQDGILLCSDGFHSLMEKERKKYFSILQYKRAGNIFNAIERLQVNANSDDSTYIIIRKNEI